MHCKTVVSANTIGQIVKMATFLLSIMLVLPLLCTIDGFTMMVKLCDTELDSSWDHVANTTAVNSLACAHACSANPTCDGISFNGGTCIQWRGDVTCGETATSGINWEVYKIRARCDSPSWYYYDGSCYLLVTTPMTWHDAVMHCATYIDSRLISVHSSGEEAFLGDVFRPRLGAAGAGTKLWLGASDEAQEGVFVWVTGEPWGYSHWVAYQPDNSKGNENCLELDVNDKRTMRRSVIQDAVHRTMGAMVSQGTVLLCFLGHYSSYYFAQT